MNSVSCGSYAMRLRLRGSSLAIRLLFNGSTTIPALSIILRSRQIFSHRDSISAMEDPRSAVGIVDTADTTGVLSKNAKPVGGFISESKYHTGAISAVDAKIISHFAVNGRIIFPVKFFSARHLEVEGRSQLHKK